MAAFFALLAVRWSFPDSGMNVWPWIAGTSPAMTKREAARWLSPNPGVSARPWMPGTSPGMTVVSGCRDATPFTACLAARL